MHLRTLKNFCDFRSDEEAATAVEYAVMLVLIAAVIIAAVGYLGEETDQSFNNFVVTLDSMKK
jgi:Flp pilus assembly pilin Flp